MVALPNPKVIGHREWASQPVVLDTATRLASGRKPDPVYNMFDMRARMRTHTTNASEDDVSQADALAALKQFFHANEIKVPTGQKNNDNFVANLTGMGQGEVNRDNAEAAALRALAGNVSDTKAAILTLAQAVNTTGMTPEQVTALAAQLAPLLPRVNEDELAAAFGERLVNG